MNTVDRVLLTTLSDLQPAGFDTICEQLQRERNAISEGRFKFLDDGETVEDMLWLQVDHQKQRIDHLPNRKKDTADCLAAIAFHLTHQVQPWGFVGKIEGAGFAAAIASPTLGGQVTNVPGPRFNVSEMDLIRSMRGMPAR